MLLTVWPSFLIVFMARSVFCDAEGRLTVAESLEQCTLQNQDLFCNFMGLEESVIYLESQSETIQKVYIQNARALHISETFCNNVFLQNVDQVTVAEDGVDKQCQMGFELAAKESHLDSIPEGVRKIYIDKCSLKNLVIRRNLENLKIIDSVISKLDISSAFGNNTNVLIIGSRIEVLRKLVMDQGSELTVRDTNVTSIEKSGLVLKDGVINITDTMFPNMTSESIILHSKVTINLGNYNGVMKLSASQEDNGDYFTEFVLSVSLVCLLVLGTISYCVYCNSFRGSEQKNQEERHKDDVEARLLKDNGKNTEVLTCPNYSLTPPSTTTDKGTSSVNPIDDVPNKQKELREQSLSPNIVTDKGSNVETESNRGDAKRRTVLERQKFSNEVPKAHDHCKKNKKQ